MVALGSPCPLCEAPLTLARLPSFSGDEAPMRITLHGMPALACDKPHVYFAKRDFPIWLMNHLMEQDEASLPAGEAVGLLFKSYLCHECRKPLQPRRDHIHSFHLPVTYPGQAEFRVEIAMPVFKCSGCGEDQMHSLGEVRKLVPVALVHAFKAAGIKPPG